MITYSWRLELDRGAVNSTFDARCIFAAFARITRYFDVRFLQVTGSPSIRFVLTTQQKDRSWAAWTSGRTVFVPASFRYQSKDQLTFVLLHELGHVFGGSAHARPGNIMAPSIGNIYQNFTEVDTAWFRLPFKRGIVKPWQEPNVWRPVKTEDGRTFETLWDDDWACSVGHADWSDWWRNLWAKRDVEKVTE